MIVNDRVVVVANQPVTGSSFTWLKIARFVTFNFLTWAVMCIVWNIVRRQFRNFRILWVNWDHLKIAALKNGGV